MTPIEALQDVLLNVKTEVYQNNTTNIKLKCTYPIFDTALDANLQQDILIIPSIEFSALSIIEVLIDGVSEGFFTIPVNSKAIWLSSLMGAVRIALNAKVTEEIEFVFDSPRLLKFMNIAALPSYFGNGVDILSLGLSSEQFLIGETSISPSDENALSALRNAINLTETVIENNGTDVIKIKNTFPIFGSAISQTFVVDNLLTFKDTQKIGTQIHVKKDGVFVTDYTFTKNTKHLYLSEILGTTRDLLYTKVAEEYELFFIYDTFVNNQIVTGETTNFTYANLVANSPLTYNLFELSNANVLTSIPIETNECNFTVAYDLYDRSMKSAVLELSNGQNIQVEYVLDNSLVPPKKYLKLSHNDTAFNVSVEMLTSLSGLRNYITLLKDFGSGLIE